MDLNVAWGKEALEAAEEGDAIAAAHVHFNVSEGFSRYDNGRAEGDDMEALSERGADAKVVCSVVPCEKRATAVGGEDDFALGTNVVGKSVYSGFVGLVGMGRYVEKV